MVRTRDTAGVKVPGAKASRKTPPAPAASSSTPESSTSKNKYAGGNPYCPRETPAWQKPITQFFAASKSGESSGQGSSGACSSTSSQGGQSSNGES